MQLAMLWHVLILVVLCVLLLAPRWRRARPRRTGWWRRWRPVPVPCGNPDQALS
jgi:hypothetical protein